METSSFDQRNVALPHLGAARELRLRHVVGDAQRADPFPRRQTKRRRKRRPRDEQPIQGPMVRDGNAALLGRNDLLKFPEFSMQENAIKKTGIPRPPLESFRPKGAGDMLQGISGEGDDVEPHRAVQPLSLRVDHRGH